MNLEEIYDDISEGCEWPSFSELQKCSDGWITLNSSDLAFSLLQTLIYIQRLKDSGSLFSDDDYDELSRENKYLNSEMSLLEDRISKYRDTIDELSAANDELNDKLMEKIAKHDRESAQYQKVIDDLKRDLAIAQATGNKFKLA